MEKCILFVDDEPNILKGLQRSLRPLGPLWDMEFAEGAPKAPEPVKSAHQYLSKLCEKETLIAAITRSCALGDHHEHLNTLDGRDL